MSLCFGCHQFFDEHNREAYHDFKLKQLGDKGFKNLMIQVNAYKKKDRKMMVIIWRAALKKLCQEKKVEMPKI